MQWDAGHRICEQQAGGACGSLGQVGCARPAEKDGGIWERDSWAVGGEGGEMADGWLWCSARAHVHEQAGVIMEDWRETDRRAWPIISLSIGYIH